jgi:outer membrane protein TolC
VNAQEAAHVEKGDSEVQRLQQDRKNTLQQAVDFAVEQYRHGVTDFLIVLRLQRELLDAELDMSDPREEKMRALAKHLKIANESLALMEARYQAGGVTKMDVLLAKSEKLHVEIQLARMRETKAGKHPR